MGWFYLIIAAVFEIGWPFGLKMASIYTVKSYIYLWIIFAIIAMTLSGVFLFMAQKTIPIGMAYAIWTGIGAACTFAIGVFVFHDGVDLIKLLGVFLIISGVVLLKISH